MMQLAVARCFAPQQMIAVLVVRLADNTRVHRFYERFGFQFVESRRFGNDGYLVYRVNRADWHLKVLLHRGRPETAEQNICVDLSVKTLIVLVNGVLVNHPYLF
ncbi:hypothetical protein LC612_41950 [Nostoc sp. CHAB 5834]|nr:hypothetical protein [Nostoc sp. CHAB 5834]